MRKVHGVTIQARKIVQSSGVRHARSASTESREKGHKCKGLPSRLVDCNESKTSERRGFLKGGKAVFAERLFASFLASLPGGTGGTGGTQLCAKVRKA